MREFERSLYPWNQDDNIEKDVTLIDNGFNLPQSLEESLAEHARGKRHRKRLPFFVKKSLEIYQTFLEDSYRDLSAWKEKQACRQVFEQLGVILSQAGTGKAYIDKSLSHMSTLAQEIYLRDLLREYKKKGETKKVSLVEKKLASLGCKV